ncbi:MAG: hypothetical protein ACHP84_11275 [Caulobacterales bacterium]
MGRATRATACAVTLTALALTGAAGPARAQAYIGVIAGQIAAQEEAAREEAACRAGMPATPKAVVAVTARMDRVMSAYFALTAKSDARALAKVFAMKSQNLRWKDDSGSVPVDQLGERLAAPAAAPVRTSVAVGGDAASGRELWTVTPAGANAAPVVYAVDFTTEDGHMFDYALGIRILHIALMPASEAPPAPGAFCHLDPLHGY